MIKPFNALCDIPKGITVSENHDAERIMGTRNLPANSVTINLPCELGYHCPVCVYPHEVDGDFDERLDWSEYNGFLYCYICNKDYPTILCIPKLNTQEGTDQFTVLYLKSVEEVINRKNAKEPIFPGCFYPILPRWKNLVNKLAETMK